MPDHRQRVPAAARNRQPIREVLQRLLPAQARILEVASGSGEHAAYCADAMPGWQWQPSDAQEAALVSISAWRAHTELANLAAPIRLDTTDASTWPAGPFDAVVAINLVHIAPWRVTEALMARAAERLALGGVLYLYGPYRRNGGHTAPSNAAFDADLRRRDPRWGVRDLEAVADEARRYGLRLTETVEMPANNLSVVLRYPGSNDRLES
ncbi:DUF938 domain-containing protein [Billgrantia gudaonensis]|uniref:SAM-dependent methyltransferase n=1 Tax=Billgrantia gudaonensis TaxID=376427 RepID=A0A1G8WXL2_9GAMM|nr:DUF938 domain-containing protein [Halomonas gudaonensis]SDJ82806.1 Protein of unknown function [Halomonas gudaonensis]